MRLVLEAERLRKVFNRRVIFEEVTFSLAGRSTLLVTGRNGSGKSTLVKILAHVLTPTGGTTRITIDGDDRSATPYALMGFVSPYLNLYEEFSARENLSFALTIRGLSVDSRRIDAMLERVGLGRFVDTRARVFSSGMKQRLKYAFALIHSPPLLFLDEPMSNLDTAGKEMVRDIMEEHRKKGSLVVATNDRSEVPTFELQVDLDARPSL